MVSSREGLFDSSRKIFTILIDACWFPDYTGVYISPRALELLTLRSVLGEHIYPAL